MNCGHQEKTTEKDVKKKIQGDKILTKQRNNILSYTCPSTNINLLLEMISNHNAMYCKCTDLLAADMHKTDLHLLYSLLKPGVKVVDKIINILWPGGVNLK